MSQVQWKVKTHSGEELGPGDIPTLIQWVDEGKIGPDDLAQKGEEGEWKPVKDSLAKENSTIAVLLDPVQAYSDQGQEIGQALGFAGSVLVMSLITTGLYWSLVWSEKNWLFLILTSIVLIFALIFAGGGLWKLRHGGVEMILAAVSVLGIFGLCVVPYLISGADYWRRVGFGWGRVIIIGALVAWMGGKIGRWIGQVVGERQLSGK